MKHGSHGTGIRDKKIGHGRGAKNTYGKYGGPAVVPGDFVTGRGDKRKGTKTAANKGPRKGR